MCKHSRLREFLQSKHQRADQYISRNISYLSEYFNKLFLLWKKKIDSNSFTIATWKLLRERIKAKHFDYVFNCFCCRWVEEKAKSFFNRVKRRCCFHCLLRNDTISDAGILSLAYTTMSDCQISLLAFKGEWDGERRRIHYSFCGEINFMHAVARKKTLIGFEWKLLPHL